VELKDNDTVTMFDNHCCRITSGDTFVPPTQPTRLLTIKLDLGAKRATLVHEQRRGDHFSTRYMGNVQYSGDGNATVSWGSQPFISEYSSSGELLLDGRLPGYDQTYRARREKWVGKPLTKPVGAVRGTTVYASWNGATELASWRLIAGGNKTAAKKSGFETAIAVPAKAASYTLEALDTSGKVIGRSAPFG
jgi:hypothetical protein